MSDLFIHSDGHDLCVWQDQPDGEPACLMTKQETHSVVWDFLARHINQRDEPLPEPTDPAVRVMDADGEVAARIGDEWISRTWGPLCWEQAWHEAGPLVVQTDLDAPTPDADRPLKVGDQVFVALDAPATPLRERVCGVVMVDKNPYSVRVGYAGIFAWLHPRFLTRVSEATS